MYLNDIFTAQRATFDIVKPGHEMYLNIYSFTMTILFFFVKPGHEMYLNITGSTSFFSHGKLNQDMRCI